MEWFIMRNSTLLMRVAADDIVYVAADGNSSELVLINGRSRTIGAQLHRFEEKFKELENASMFIRVGRSLIVNSRYVQLIDLTEQKIVFGGKHLVKKANTTVDGRSHDIYTIRGVPRDALKQLKEQLEVIKNG
ncbi:MAG: LytTR family transcriptional regulator DNA-binding domain-containing protein [Prevotella sp.]|nr:LytTR family transcriptional regulator DNA-binding domain-containing protein [Prevotella sp.]